MIELTKNVEKGTITWNREAQEAFETLKTKLTTEPVLAHPLFDTEFILQTDASAYAVGDVLSQTQKGKEVAIAYASRHLNTAEKKYASIEREAVAIMFGTKYFKHYLADNPFTIETDCRPLLWLENIKETETGRLGRWGIQLSAMKYRIKYKPGKIHKNADFFSRQTIAVIEQGDNQFSLQKEQQSDPFCSQVYLYLT